MAEADVVEPKSGGVLQGAAKKEAFFQAAESMVRKFSFSVPDMEPDEKRADVRLASTNSCKLEIKVLRHGWVGRLHYHPNMDGIWMVLKGRLRWYGPHDKLMGELGPMDGIVQPENTRYWFESVGDEEAWLVQIGGYPKGKDAARKIHI
jgi:mannose-6-phosphate isomerase-like protein (cupin superfamily)